MIDFVEVKGWILAAGSLRQNWRVAVAKGWEWLVATVMMLPMFAWRALLVFAREPGALVVAGIAVAIAFGAGDVTRHARDRSEIKRMASEIMAERADFATKSAAHISQAAQQGVRIQDLERQVAKLTVQTQPVAEQVKPIVAPSPRAPKRSPKSETVPPPQKPWGLF